MLPGQCPAPSHSSSSSSAVLLLLAPPSPGEQIEKLNSANESQAEVPECEIKA